MHRFATAVLACLAAAALAGCASTPQATVEAGNRTTHALKNAPTVAAGCVARNAENITDAVVARVRSLDPSGAQEVVVGNPSTLFVQSMFVLQIRAEGADSSASIYSAPIVSNSNRERWVTGMLKGC